MNNLIMNSPSHAKRLSRSALALFSAFVAIAMLVSSASAQTPTPWPSWPPPEDKPERGQVIKAIADLLRASLKPSQLRTDLQSPDSAKKRLQDQLGPNLLLPTKMLIVFYEPDVVANASCTVQRKNSMYSIFALLKTETELSMADKELVTSHFMCCYDPY
jgi:hypothetical protein